ncbi:hypothetical protein RRF57_009719 [Xylaria bambusicola]|uniref:Uncharacterized protein n=1 Tax=Xylaria bambusicola TaxID=326684 RepID=A0AAN7UK32_9PEZI
MAVLLSKLAFVFELIVKTPGQPLPDIERSLKVVDMMIYAFKVVFGNHPRKYSSLAFQRVLSISEAQRNYVFMFYSPFLNLCSMSTTTTHEAGSDINISEGDV